MDSRARGERRRKGRGRGVKRWPVLPAVLGQLLLTCHLSLLVFALAKLSRVRREGEEGLERRVEVQEKGAEAEAGTESGAVAKAVAEAEAGAAPPPFCLLARSCY